ncbi:hypothetical protein GCM10022199_02240 [Marihabitans asiaticum]|uniref:YdeI/OmpD-associated family protein n=1 Tax=Marihabitans asiaticum TaxID=415218 RepID=UPI0011A41056|nr:YdeI/OmpD-associated family protein [Marihabitans asiaticum]
MGYAEQGVRPPKVELEVEMPEALAADPEMAQAFDALTPGRQKSWALRVGSAKKTETRASRSTKAREKILAGKGALER